MQPFKVLSGVKILKGWKSRKIFTEKKFLINLKFPYFAQVEDNFFIIKFCVFVLRLLKL